MQSKTADINESLQTGLSKNQLRALRTTVNNLDRLMLYSEMMIWCMKTDTKTTDRSSYTIRTNWC